MCCAAGRGKQTWVQVLALLMKTPSHFCSWDLNFTIYEVSWGKPELLEVPTPTWDLPGRSWSYSSFLSFSSSSFIIFFKDRILLSQSSCLSLPGETPGICHIPGCVLGRSMLPWPASILHSSCLPGLLGLQVHSTMPDH